MKDNLKIAIVGLNGIGSYFVRGLSELIKKDVAGLEEIICQGGSIRLFTHFSLLKIFCYY